MASKKQQKYKLSQLKTLGKQLLTSTTHVNNLPILLTFVNPSSPPHHVLESILTLQSFFTPLLSQLPSSSSSLNSSLEDPELIYKTWLRSKFDEFVKSLVDVCVSVELEDTLKEFVLDTIMEFVKIGNGGGFCSAIYHKFVYSIIHSALETDLMLDTLASKYFNYIDVRYFTYISLEKLARTLESKNSPDNKAMPAVVGRDSKLSSELSIHKLMYILLRIPSLEGLGKESNYEMWSGSGLSPKEAEGTHHKAGKSRTSALSAVKIAKKMKLKFTKAWISFLRLSLPIDVYKEVLLSLHQTVIPYLSNPIMLCDFLTRSYDIGGVISVMALSSLFVLMTEHGLEYPNFYEKLYALLAPSIFIAKHRARFFELLDSCLKSPLLPAYLAASFAKKLSRLSLTAPPSGGLVIVALIHNLLRRHPSINYLVHRVDGIDNVKNSSDVEEVGDVVKESYDGTPGIDLFKNEDNDPFTTRATRSSLWEIDTLRHHYCPPVSRFVLSLENDLTVRDKTAEVTVKDFSAGSYATIFGEEIRRRVKQVPLAFYKTTPTCLFSETDFPSWSFKQVDDRAAKRQRIECS